MLTGVFIFSFVNILDKLLLEKYLKNYTLVLFKSIIWLVILCLIPFINFTIPTLNQLILIFAASFFGLIAFVPYTKAFEIEEASRLIPLLPLQSLFVLLLSAILINERLTLIQYTAFVLMLFGGVLLSIKKTKHVLKLSNGFWLMITAVFFWGLNLVIMKHIYNVAHYWSSFIIGVFISSVIGILFLLKKPIRKDFRKVLKTTSKQAKIMIISNGLLHIIALTFTMYALKQGIASLVSVLSSFQGLFVFILAIILSKFFPKVLKEDISKQVVLNKILAIILLLIGVYMLNMR
ncbi:MAG: hypothetical protein MAG795_00935 [Candidatus Woesearchaeota archaeon]|nr:hypothetical protein [Candidatus Woesearchaeota archaeon]